MSVEQYANNASTTLNGAIDNSTTTVVVTDASAFPSSGDFRIKIENELMLVTSVSSNTFTVTRGVEGTTAASHSDTTPVYHIMTKQSFLNLFRDGVSAGTFSSRPSAGRAGRLFYATDIPGIVQWDNGSVWKNLFQGYGPFDEVDPSFYPTWVNQQNATFSQYGGAVRLEDDGTNNSGEDLRLRVKTKTGTNTCTVSIGCRVYSNGRQPVVYGIAFRKTGNSNILGCGFIVRNGDQCSRYFCARWSDANTFATTQYEQFGDVSFAPQFVRFKWTGSSNFEMWGSKDGLKWFKIHAFTDTNLASFDQVGLFVNYYNPVYTDGTAPIGMDVFYLDHVET